MVAREALRAERKSTTLVKKLKKTGGVALLATAVVASASFGDNYTAAAFTWGYGPTQTGDVAAARKYLG